MKLKYIHMHTNKPYANKYCKEEEKPHLKEGKDGGNILGYQ